MKIKSTLLSTLLIFLSMISIAADKKISVPAVTELWEPKPEKIESPANGIPSDAIVLFDGLNLDEWKLSNPDSNEWIIEDGSITVPPRKKVGDKTIPSNIITKRSFGDCQLHIEFRSPTDDNDQGQQKGNSGIFFMGRYELQVLDCYENETYVNGQTASIYKQHPPLVNACRKPGEWQTYDVVFVAPRFDQSGNLIRKARITVFHNGVIVQHASVLHGPTAFKYLPQYKPHAKKLPLSLQDHTDRVSYRNIWIRDLELPGVD